MLHIKAARSVARAITAVIVAIVLTLFPIASAEAHRAPGLDAQFLSASVYCDEVTYPFCEVTGKVRIFNNRAFGTGRIVICVGIKAHTTTHRNLSIEPLRPEGEAIATVNPHRSVVTTYKTVFNDSAGIIDHVHIVHVHLHIAQGGQQC